jgi:hypothetical protein
VPVQVEVVDHLRIEQAHRVGGDRVAKAGEEFLCDRSTADHGPALDHFDLQAGHAEIGGAGEAVMAGPDHDRIVPHCPGFLGWHLERWPGSAPGWHIVHL